MSKIGCYRCTSSNGSNPACEDPFNGYDVGYEKYCKAMKKHRTGVFPASFCIKLYGHDKARNEFTFVRECSTEDLGNFKGTFRLNGRDVSGVVATCRGNGCNGTSGRVESSFGTTAFSICLIFVFSFR